ncbi:hypothetical protein ACM66B_005738 [Microbotryomycetes sp. NB124-2]
MQLSPFKLCTLLLACLAATVVAQGGSSSITNLETFPTIIVDSSPPVPTSLPSSAITAAPNATSTSRTFSASTCTSAYCSFSDASGGIIIISSVANDSSSTSSASQSRTSSLSMTSPVNTESTMLTSTSLPAPTSSADRMQLMWGMLLAATAAVAFAF